MAWQKKLFKLVGAKNNLASFFILLTYSILGFKFLRFIWRFSENILFWDQWDTFDAVLVNNNLTQVFLFQNNEHRMGVPLLIIKLMAHLTNWNVRFETFLIGLVIFTSAILALILKKRLTKKLEIYDIIIPFLFLNLYQWENLIWGISFAFILPILWLLITVYLFTLRDSLLRNINLILITILATYTHLHGLFIGIITSIFFLMNLHNTSNINLKKKYLALFLFNILAMVTYFINFQSSKFLGVDKINLGELFLYFAYQINGFIGNYSKHLVLVSITPIIAVFTFGHLLIKSFQKKTIIDNFPIIAFYAFSFLFIVTTAYGRIGIGLDSAYQSRYVTLIIPLYFGIYLYFLSINNLHFKGSLSFFIFIFFIFISAQNNHFNYVYAENRKISLANWKQCYLEHESLDFCERTAGYIIYHSPKNINLESKLHYLKRHRLNFYSE